MFHSPPLSPSVSLLGVKWLTLCSQTSLCDLVATPRLVASQLPRVQSSPRLFFDTIQRESGIISAQENSQHCNLPHFLYIMAFDWFLTSAPWDWVQFGLRYEFVAAGERTWAKYRRSAPCREGAVGRLKQVDIDWQIDSCKVAIDWANSQFLTPWCTGGDQWH